MEFLEKLKNSTAAWVVLAIIAIASLGWAIYTYYSSNKKKRFSAIFSEVEIIKRGKNRIRELEFTFKGKTISNLTISRCSIWNSGNKVIESADIVANHQLEIDIEDDAEILEAQIISEVDDTNAFNIQELSPKRVVFDFDYVDSHEGVSVQIIHTGKKGSLHPKCKIKGGKSVKQCFSTSDPNYSYPLGRKRKRYTVVTLIESIAFVVLSLMMIGIHFRLFSDDFIKFLTAFPEPGTGLYKFETTVVILMCMVAIISIIISIILLRDYLSVGVPSKLKLSDDFSGDNSL